MTILPTRFDLAGRADAPDEAVKSDAAIFVCITCKRADDAGARPGEAMFQAVRERLVRAPAPRALVRAVECLSVCKRPCTVALAGAGKWTYVVGDLDAAANADDVIDAARKYIEAPDGIIPWRQRPQSFRKGVIARTPPLPELARGAGR